MSRSAAWAVSVLLGLSISNVFAAEWTAGVGDFDEGSNWNSGDVPGLAEEARINNGGTAQLSAGFVDNTALRLGATGPDSGNFEQTGGSYGAVGAFIGDQGNGSARITAGDFLIGGDSIHVGWRPEGVGELTIDGQDAVVTSGDDFQLGREGTGTLSFSDGQLRAGFTVIGKFGTGIWNQSGGLFDQDFGDIEIGDGGRDDQAGTAGPRQGTLNLSGGFIQTAGHLAIGNRRGTGTVNVSGGIIAATGGSENNIYVGRGADSSPGVGGPTELRVMGSEAIIVATGSLFMNLEEVSVSSTLTAEITGAAHSTIKVTGDADVQNGILRVELGDYQPTANDAWLLVHAGAELDEDLDVIDQLVDTAGYDPPVHEFGGFQGEVRGPFMDVDTSAATLPAGLEWDVNYTSEFITLSIMASDMLPGDFNDDGVLDAGDIDLLTAASATGANNPVYDLTNDNLVNEDDVAFWAKDLANTWIGDANLDREFNSSDFVQVFEIGKYDQDVDAVWSEGDWTGDGRFDSGDFVAAFVDGGYETGPPPEAVRAVPEPSCAFLLGIGMLGLCRLRTFRVRRRNDDG